MTEDERLQLRGFLHDLNNALGTLQGLSHVLNSAEVDDKTRQDLLKKIYEASIMAEETSQQMYEAFVETDRQ